MAGIYLVIVIVLLQGTLIAEGGNLGRCLDILINVRTTETDQCSAVNEFIKCLIQELNLFKTRASQSEITNFENVVKDNLARLGLRCRVDFRAILRQIRVEEENGVTYATRQPTGFIDANTKGECINALIISNTAADTVDCALVSPFVKCIIRVTGYYKDIPTRMDESSLLSDTQAQLNKLGLYCTVDISVLSEEVARDIATSAPTPSAVSITSNTIFTTSKTISAMLKSICTTATTISTAAITIPETPQTVSTTPSAMSKMESTTLFTTTPEEGIEVKRTCYGHFSHMYSAGVPQCWSVKEYVKCLLEVLNLLTSNVSDRGMEDFEVLVRKRILLTGVQCDNISEIIRTIQEEETNGVTQPTGNPITTTKEEIEVMRTCNTYLQHMYSGGAPPCVLAKIHIECLLRVLNVLTSNVSDRGMEDFEVLVRSSIRLPGVRCDNISEIIRTIRHDEIKRVTQPTDKPIGELYRSYTTLKSSLGLEVKPEQALNISAVTGLDISLVILLLVITYISLCFSL